MRFLDLGALQIQLGQDRISAGGRRPAAALSTLLLHLNRRVSVDLLLDAVWGDLATASSAGTLETHIWRLRRLLEPGRTRGQAASILLSDSGGYRLVATADQVDSARFEQLALDVVGHLATGQPSRALQAADQALALWRGTPLAEVADRSWAVGPLARMQEMRVTLQERRVDAILEVGRPEVAVSELQPLISEHPFRERLWWQRMLALHRCGRTEEALNAFHRARRSLITEIGMGPGPELVDLQQRILRRDPTLDLPVVRPPRAPPRGVEVHLPRPRALIGRRRDQAELVAALSTSALVTISGPAGCGKTLLAIETARAAAPEFVDGVWFVDLSTADVDADVAATVATVLDLPVPPASSPLQVLAAYGQDRRVLLVLDNCEQVLDQAAELCEVLTQPELQVAVLTTSREPLGLEAEQVHALGPLPVQDPTGAPAQLPAVALFVARSRLRAHDLGPLELASVLQICRAVDGIPLAVELAAALTSTYTLTEIAEQVERDPGQLSAIGRGQARHHQTLIAAIERSHRLLSPEEQVVHRRLSVLPGTFSRPVAEAVVGPDVDRPVSGVLAQLVHRSLLTVAHPGGADTEFTQLAPVRAHARHALERSGELDLAEQLRDRWTVAVARRRPPAGSTAEGAWHAQIFGNLGTIRATLHRRLITEPGPLGAEVAVQLTGFWFYQDLLEEGGRWIELALRKAADTGPATLPTQLSLAGVLLMQGRIDQGRDLFHEALAGVRAAVPDQPVHRVPGPDRPPALDDPMLVAELLLAAAAAFSIARDAGSMRTALAVVGASGALEDDPHLAAGHEAISCLAESMSAPLELTLARAEASFARATAVGNLWAGWLSCSSATSVALARRDAALGLPWSQRLMHLQAQLGARAVLQQVETFGDFLALDGRFLPAVRVFSATNHQARRTGRRWPHNLLTPELLDRCRAALTADEFDRAWATGPALSRTELTDCSAVR